MENGHVDIAQNCVYLTVLAYPPSLTHIHKKCMPGIPKLSLHGAIGCLSKCFHGALGKKKYLIIPLIRSLGPNNVIVVVCTMSCRCCSVSFIHLQFLMVPSWVWGPASLCLSTQCGDHQYTLSWGLHCPRWWPSKWNSWPLDLLCHFALCILPSFLLFLLASGWLAF